LALLSAPFFPAADPPLGWLVGGFVLLAIGLAALTMNRRHGRLESAQGTSRALLYALVYGLCAACFARVIGPALLVTERSPWLLALGDVIFVTLGVFVWVMVLAENRPFAAFGFKGAPAGRLLPALLLGVGAAALWAGGPWLEVLRGRVRFGHDELVFATLFASVGSALPEEILFRGYLMSSLDGRFRRWTRVAVPALAFTVVRSLRYLPGPDLSPAAWIFYVAAVVFPLGLWWGLLRDLAGGSLWPCLVSHFLLEFVSALAGTSPALSFHTP
jgi:membrane protease YdiL (CAAX protease family)